MTQLLVSVRDSAESAIVESCSGVSFIDFKEPNAGSLGAVDAKVLASVAKSKDPKFEYTFAAGELVDLEKNVNEWLPPNVLRKFRYVKVGLARAAMSNWSSVWAQRMGGLPDGTTPVGVIYVDGDQCGAPSIEAVIEASHRLNCEFVLLDTYNKSRGTIFDCLDSEQLNDVLKLIHQKGMRSVIAGSITTSNLSKALSLNPNVIGVRGAVCDGNRTSQICKSILETFVNDFLEQRKILSN